MPDDFQFDECPARPMHIGLIIDAYDPFGGGEQRWTAQLHAHLLQRGHRVTVLTFAANNTSIDAELCVLGNPGTVLGRAAAVARARAAMPSVVFHDTGTGWSADIFHPQAGSRLLSMDRYHASFSLPRRLRMAISPRLQVLRVKMRHVELRAVQHAHKVVAVSRFVGEHLIQRYGISADKIAYVPNGVALERFAPARLAPLRAPMRASLGLGQELLCLAVARNPRLKGVDTSLRALAELRQQGMAVRLLLAGSEPDGAMVELARSLGVADEVVFAGDVPDIESLYAASDIMLHPTRWDACSLATIEGMAAGLPVVTSLANGASDLIQHGSSGFVVGNAEDAGGLAAAVRDLREPELRARIGAAARAAAARASITLNCSRIESLLIEAKAVRMENSIPKNEQAVAGDGGIAASA